MKTTMHTAIVSSFLFSLVAAGLSACPSFAEENGIDFWNMGIYQQQIESCQVDRGRMQIENEETLRRLALKDEILKDLIAGSIDYQVAAERFMVINRTLASPTAYLLQYPGMSELERATRQLVTFLRTTRGEQARYLADQIEVNLVSSCE